MELKDFVSKTLSQIIEGVKDAQIQAVKHGAKVNPTLTFNDMNNFRTYMVTPISNGASPIFMVDFDVAIIASESEGINGGGGLNVAAIRIGAQGESISNKTLESRVKFMIPITLPFECEQH